MGEKKIMMFIVEGMSDMAALGTIMKEYFSGREVQFVIVHGDITTKDFTSSENVVKKVNTLVEGLKQRYRYNTEDFLKIIQLTDMDGVFVPDHAVWQEDTTSVRYFPDHMETGCVEAVLDRNHKKAEVLRRLRKTGKINGIPYRIYFNSCNLEHVLYGELRDYTDEEKEACSDDFAEQYEGRSEEFVKLVSAPEVAVPGTYQKTWDYIEKGGNSLNRHSNMHLLFEK